jgi:DNA-binding NarL/FixJ family response regulator
MAKFLLIDDHEIVRAGVKNVIISYFSPCEVLEATGEESAKAVLADNQFDVVITDVQMPDTNIFGLLSFIKAQNANTRVLVFSMSSENIYAKKFLSAGAVGFVSKNAGLAELKKGVEAALSNRRYVSKELAQKLADEFGENHTNPFVTLTPKEFEIANLLIMGKSVTDISKLLVLSTSTIGTHKARIFNKLKVTNLVELHEIGKQHNVGV